MRYVDRIVVSKLCISQLVGVRECYLAQLLAVHGGSSSLSMYLPDHLGRPTKDACSAFESLEVFAEEIAHSLNSISLDVSIQLVGKNLLKDSYYMTLNRTRLLDLNETSFESRHDPSVLVYRSDPVRVKPDSKKTGWLWWKNIQVKTENLCRGTPWRPIELCVYNGKSVLVGRTLMAAVDFDACSRLFRPSHLVYKMFSKDNFAIVGQVSVKVNELVQQYSFLDYVTGGLEFGVMVGIDFTRSNGDARLSNSLHSFIPVSNDDSYDETVYIPGPQNDYVLVLRSVLEILQQYDADKQIPVYGFGAKLPPSNTIVSHCFALNGDFFKPEVNGIEGVLRAYQEALGAVTLHGPTRICEILKRAGDYAQAMVGKAKYAILLLITDGVIEDFQASINAIVDHLADLPLSIVIVGVGSEDFSQMKILDADDHALVSSETGATMHRDIVQFIPFNEFKDQSFSELAKATLEEIPREVIRYFGEKKIFPSPSMDKERKSRKFLGFTGTTVAASSVENTSSEKADLIKLITDQGYDGDIVTRVVNETGVLCIDPMHVMDVMFHLHRHKATMIRQYGVQNQSMADRLGVEDLLAPERREPVKEEQKPKNGMKGTLCGVCYTNEIDIALRNCGHEVVCHACFEAMPPICPLCRGVVNGTVDI